jgi:succinate dehydrogenase / fumarate reductase cytochrome b subunit
MADPGRGRRPLSPHLTIYRPQITSVLSILHRITGVVMTLAALMIVWWFLAASVGPAYYERADRVLTSVLGQLVLILSLWALWFHFCNGLRHLWWDSGRGFGLDQVSLSGRIAVGASVALTVITLIVATR